MNNLYSFRQKYAIMPLSRIEDDTENIYAYCVCPCEFIKEVDVLENGKTLTAYDVVYSFNQAQQNIKPIYDEQNKCLNSVVVDKVFVDLNLAKQTAEELNDKIAKEKIKTTPATDLKKAITSLREDFKYALNIQEKMLEANREIYRER